MYRDKEGRFHITIQNDSALNEVIIRNIIQVMLATAAGGIFRLDWNEEAEGFKGSLQNTYNKLPKMFYKKVRK